MELTCGNEQNFADQEKRKNEEISAADRKDISQWMGLQALDSRSGSSRYRQLQPPNLYESPERKD